MFRCTVCNKVVPPKTSCKKIVNTKIYYHPFRSRVQRRLGFDKNGKKKVEWRDDPGGTGPQIISEHPVCPTCASAHGL